MLLCLKRLVAGMAGGDARCVEDNLVVLPKALEEPQGSTLAIAVRQRKLQYFGEGSVPVDRAEQPVLERVDGANKIGKCVRSVNQHRDATRRQTFPNAHRPWQRNGDVVAPTITGKCDRLVLNGAVIAIGNETVRDHRPAEKLDGGVLQSGGQRGQARSVRAIGQNPTLGEVGSLLDPATEGHAAPIEPSIDLRNGVGAILWMQERVRHRFRPPEILRPVQQT